MTGHKLHQIWSASAHDACPRCDSDEVFIFDNAETNTSRACCQACLLSWPLGADLFVCTCEAFIGDNDQAILHARENDVCETCLGSGEVTPMGGSHGTCTSCGGSGVGYDGIEETVTLKVVLKVRKSDIVPNSDVNQPAEFIGNEFATRTRRLLSGHCPPGDPLDGVVVGTIGPVSRAMTIYTGRVANVMVVKNEIKVEDAT